jgi:hypothetical protein
MNCIAVDDADDMHRSFGELHRQMSSDSQGPLAVLAEMPLKAAHDACVGNCTYGLSSSHRAAGQQIAAYYEGKTEGTHMNSLIAAVPGQWYLDRASGDVFQIISVGDQTIDIQYVDGSLAEDSWDDWMARRLVLCEQPAASRWKSQGIDTR